MTSATEQTEARGVAGEYARALLDLASEAALAEQVADELAGLAELVGRVDALAEFLTSPIVSKGAKADAMSRALHGRVCGLVENFIGVLLRNRRGGLLAATAEAYREELNLRAGRREVLVSSAVALEEGELAELASALRETIGAEPIMRTSVVPELLGGLRVQIGERVIDASIWGRLGRMRQALSRRPSGGEK